MDIREWSHLAVTPIDERNIFRAVRAHVAPVLLPRRDNVASPSYSQLLRVTTGTFPADGMARASASAFFRR